MTPTMPMIGYSVSLFSVSGRLRRDNRSAQYRTSANLRNSDGCREATPRSSQRADPFVRRPRPGMRTSTNRPMHTKSPGTASGRSRR